MKTISMALLLLVSLSINGVLINRRLQSSPAASPGQAAARDLDGSKPNGNLPPASRFGAARLVELASQLRSSDLPAPLLRVWITAAVDELYQEREETLRPPRRERYWQPEPVMPLATQIARLELRLEKAQLLEAVLGYDPDRPGNRPYDFVPLSRQQAVKAVAEKYFGLLEAHRQTTLGMATASEEATIARLETEQKTALSAWLTEDEQRLLNTRLTVTRWTPAGEMASAFPENRTPLTERLRKDLRAFDATEKEFVAINAIQSEFDHFRYNGGMDSSDLNQAVRERIRDVLGPERFAQYLEKSDYDYARVSDLVNRLGLPSSVTTDVTALQDRVIIGSARVNDDTSLDIEAKRAVLISLAENERARIASILGTDGAAAVAFYMNQWLRPLEQGNVVWSSEPGVRSTAPVGRPIPKGR